MTKENLATGVALNQQIDTITAVQAALAETGAAVAISGMNGDGKTSIVNETIKSALGATAYNTLMAGFLTDLGTALTSAKTTAQNAFDALGV